MAGNKISYEVGGCEASGDLDDMRAILVLKYQARLGSGYNINLLSVPWLLYGLLYALDERQSNPQFIGGLFQGWRYLLTIP